MSAPTPELRSFLAAVAERRHRSPGIPRALYALARQVLGSADLDAVQDLLASTLLDLLERGGQAGGIKQLLLLDDRALARAIRRRMVQVRARQYGSKSQAVKSLRAHVRAALLGELPPAEGLPVSLTAGDRLCSKLVRQAVAEVLAHVDAPAREPRAVASRLWSIFFEDRHEDIRDQAHGQDDGGHEDLVLAQADASRHANHLRRHLGPGLTQVVAQRVRGLTLAQVGAGWARASTVHEQQARAVEAIRAHVQRYGLVREDLEPALMLVAA